MSRGAGATPLWLVVVTILLGACVDIPTGDSDVLSLQFNSLPSPSVVVGDTLRDSSGVIVPATVTAYNYSGDVVDNIPVTFSTVDRGIRVDAASGRVFGDSVRTGARIFASLKGLSGIATIAVSLRPDTVVGSNARDSLSYSLTDTAANISPSIGVRVIHGPIAGDTSVASYYVSFRILSPADAALARLVRDDGVGSSADTTDAGGIAARKIKIDVRRLTSLVDSVVVQANVRYRGIHVRGSPARLVLKVKPK